jgi:hypothetical protein
MLDRVLSLVVAISLALLAWIYARSRDQEVLDNVTVPVQVVLTPSQADHYTLELTSPGQVAASFTGPPYRIRELHGMLQRKELQVVITVTVPDERLSVARYSDSVVVEASAIPAPLGVTALVPEGRNRVSFTLHRMRECWLPVRFDNLRDGPPGNYQIDPAMVLVRGPQEVLDRAQFIRTEDIPARQGLAGSVGVVQVPLVDTLEGRPVRVTPPRVRVRMPTQARKIYELTDVPVQFLLPANFPLKPKFHDERNGKVNLKLVGPDQDEPPRVTAYIDLSRGKYISGLNHESLQLQLPKDFQLAPDIPGPKPVAFELMPADDIPGSLGIGPP